YYSDFVVSISPSGTQLAILFMSDGANYLKVYNLANPKDTICRLMPYYKIKNIVLLSLNFIQWADDGSVVIVIKFDEARVAATVGTQFLTVTRPEYDYSYGPNMVVVERRTINTRHIVLQPSGCLDAFS